MRQRVLGALLLPLLATGCKHACEEDGGEIHQELTNAGVVMDGAVACAFGAPSKDHLMEHVAFSKVYHSGDFKRVGLDYLKHAEKNGWERVGCAGGLGKTGLTEHRMSECLKKGDKRVKYEAYDFDGTCVNINLLRLKTPAEVAGNK